MKKTVLLFFFTIQISLAQVTVNIYDNVLFYDGYASLVSNPTAPDVIRLRNDLFTKKITDAQLATIADGNYLTLNVSISAACDNYDRIGNVNLAFVPKGASTYDPNVTDRIEVGRFITPFMNKNVPPNLVPYSFNVSNLLEVFNDQELFLEYDFWLEFEVFGVPYAANTQIAGCAGRNDVFYGTVDFVTNSTSPMPLGTYTNIIPLNFKKNLNNYQAGASDAIGLTIRTINFDVPVDLTNASFYLITSNHGANSGGEEYNRRWHYISYDGTNVLTYRPGETTCEPYRVYNTQANGIYGPTPRTDAQWQSFSNWCPGAKIPIREIYLGNVAAGNHTFVINVPTAQFVNNEGYFPISLYMQGESFTLNSPVIENISTHIYPNPTVREVTVTSLNTIQSYELMDIQGRKLTERNTNQKEFRIDVSMYPNGIYFLKMKTDFGTLTKKIVKK